MDLINLQKAKEKSNYSLQLYNW